MQQVDILAYGEDLEVSRFSIFVAFPVTLHKLKDSLPIAGDFHYRHKVAGHKCGFPDIEFLWIDLEDSDLNTEIISDTACMEISALVIDVPECDDEYSYNDYLSDVSVHIPIERPPAMLKSEKESESNDNEDDGNPLSLRSLGKVINNISKGVESNPALQKNMLHIKSGMEKLTATTGKVWKSVLVNVSNLQQRQGSVESYVTSPVANDNLTSLSIKMSTTFKDSLPEHMTLITQLWTVLFPRQNFQRMSFTWKEAGYQGQDPIADLKSTGLLSMYCLVFIGETQTERLQKMVQDNKANTKSNYPLAVVAVNLTMLLIELFHLKENRFLNVAASYWDLFLSDNAFFEVFTILLVHMDNIWRARSAERADFGKIIGEVKAVVKRVLLKGPCSIDDFKNIARDEGIAVVS
jgi:hypothetical protein